MSGGGSVSAHGLGRVERGAVLLEGVDLHVEGGRVLGIVGPNGSGKSTLVRCLAGITGADEGEVRLDGRPLGEHGGRQVARRLAFVGQETASDIDHRVEDVVRLGRLPHRGRLGGAAREDDDLCLRALADVGLEGFGRRRWSGLSGGERQRVQVARALAQQPAVLVLDEPLNHLDVRHQFDLLRLLAERPMTVVVVLHDLALAARWCDELLVLADGRAEASGPPADVLHESSLAEVFGVRGSVRVRDGVALVELEDSLRATPAAPADHGLITPPGHHPSRPCTACSDV